MITSFSNPNYQLNDALNSNLPQYQQHDYHDNHIYHELVTSHDSDDVVTSQSNNASASKRRKKYAVLDAGEQLVQQIGNKK